MLARFAERSHVVEPLQLRRSEVQIGCWLLLRSEEGTREAGLIAPANFSQSRVAMSEWP